MENLKEFRFLIFVRISFYLFLIQTRLFVLTRSTQISSPIYSCVFETLSKAKSSLCPSSRSTCTLT